MSKRGNLTQERDDEIERLFVSSFSYDYIARKLNLTRNVVAGVCHRRGLRRPAPLVISPEEQAERAQDQRDIDMLHDIRDGHSIRETARHWGVSFNYLQAIAKAAKEAA